MTASHADFPAAHSMDTLWFAVDDDGSIGYFDSGEPGAVPVEATQGGGWELITKLQHGLAARIWAAGNVRGVHCAAGDEVPRRDGYYQVMLFLREPPAHAELREDEFQVLPELPGDAGRVVPVVSEFLASPTYSELHAGGNCLGCGHMDGGGMANLGFYAFECSDYRMGPYARLGSPPKPLKLSDLPEDVISSDVVRLPGVRFHDAAEVQPLEHVRCQTCARSTYVGTDGMAYPLPEGTQRPPEAPPPPRRWWELWKA